MRRQILFLMAIILLGASIHCARAGDAEFENATKCLPSKFKSDGSKEDTIKKIFARRDCIKQQEKGRIGKWFCYVTEMAGVQKSADGTVFSGKIKPEVEKFVATISEPFSDAVRLSACQQEYGFAGGDYTSSNNACLANFEIQFSPRVASLEWSE